MHGTHDPAPADEPPQGRPLPHPSNTPWEAAPGTGVAWVAWARDQLPERPRGRGQTTGIILGSSDGSGERMVSGHEPESDLAGLILATSDVFPEHRLRDLAIADVARHVETKLAVRQAEAGVTHTVVVLNNRMCDGLYGCTEAVAAILPPGVLHDGMGTRAQPTDHHRRESHVTVVVTAIIDNDRYYARTEEERAVLIRRMVDEEHPGWASLVYVWDRPAGEGSGRLAWPAWQLRVSTEPGLGVGALNWVGPVPSDELGPWDTLNSTPIAGVAVEFDGSVPSYFPPSAVLPIDDVRRAVAEHFNTGRRPECVQWQPGYRF